MKATEQYFPVVLFIILYKVVLLYKVYYPVHVLSCIILYKVVGG